MTLNTLKTIVTVPASLLLAGGLMLGVPAQAFAHCDGLDGPVVKAAQQALASRNPAFVLIWVQPKDEPEIQRAFEQTLAVRALGPEANALADRYFFETVVRVHRAGEGAAFTGLKPAGRDLGAAIPTADTALENGEVEPLVALLTSTIRAGLREQFAHVMAAKKFTADDVAAGRQYVQAYVEFIHYVERLYEAATRASHGHFDETERVPDRH